MDESARTRVRSIFVSDIHLGCRHSKADLLLSFLKEHTCDYLYLVGDILDGWKMHRGFHWNDTYTLVIRRIFGMVKRGTIVRYAAGNHDEFLRNYMDELQMALTGHIEIADEFVHTTADGRMLVGDSRRHLRQPLDQHAVACPLGRSGVQRAVGPQYRRQLGAPQAGSRSTSRTACS